MKLTAASSEVERLRALIASRLGLEFASDKFSYLAEVAQKRLVATTCSSFESYLELLASRARGVEELRWLAQELTVTETFFFRGAEHFRVFEEVVLARARARGRRLRVVSAGCASGEEPYSLAIVTRESTPDLASWDAQITAIDVNPAMLRKAASGRYSSWSLRATPEAVKRAYFRSDGRDFVIDGGIRDAVVFEERNLADDQPSFWAGLQCDAIFCRNVLMYFSPELMQRIVSWLSQALLPGGFLFLGHAETLRGLSQEYHLCHTHEAFYYQKRGEAEASSLAGLPSQRAAQSLDLLPSVVRTATSWVDAIQQASERIAVLANERGLPRATATRQQVAHGEQRAAARRTELTLALDLMRQERFAEALELVRSLSPDSSEDPDTLLLLAVLLTNQGALADAERACRRLLALDELSAGAHYLMALCREHVADRASALEHDQTAIYLDASFAMPHLHLGLLSKRSGERALARRELSQALLLLAREDASRLVLFGGGFSREALTRLCRAELDSLGAES